MLSAIVVSLCVTGMLLTVNQKYATSLDNARFIASFVPLSGDVTGRSIQGGVWKPNVESFGILFGVASPGRSGDLDYWQDVALLTASSVPDVQFVGLCGDPTSCSASKLGGGEILVLEFMDATQVHALTTAASQGRAFLFHGSSVLGMIPLPGNREALAEQIAGTMRGRIRRESQ